MTEHARRRSDDSWHLEKRVNVGHILTTLTIAGGLLVWGMKMDNRMSTMEANHKNLSDRVDRAVIRTETQITEINRKLDRFIEIQFERERERNK